LKTVLIDYATLKHHQTRIYSSIVRPDKLINVQINNEVRGKMVGCIAEFSACIEQLWCCRL